MSEINRICPVVGKTYVDSQGCKLKCIYQLKGNKDYPFVFICVDDYGDESESTCFSDSGSSTFRWRRLVRELGPYDDFKIDDPVMVRESVHHPWERRYFAGTDEHGRPTTWELGRTKWSSLKRGNPFTWNECRKPTKEELED